MYSLNVITPPAVEPVTLEEAQAFLVVVPATDDGLIEGFITAARQMAEKYTHRAFYTQQWRLSLDRFPIFWSRNEVKNMEDSYYPYSFFFSGLTINLPLPHTLSVDAITYVAADNTTQTLTSDMWFCDFDSEPARLIPALGAYWPTTSVYIPGSVKINFTCGSYGDGIDIDNCPQNVKTAIALLASHLYVNREGSVAIPDAFYRLLDSEKFDVFTFSDY